MNTKKDLTIIYLLLFGLGIAVIVLGMTIRLQNQSINSLTNIVEDLMFVVDSRQEQISGLIIVDTNQNESIRILGETDRLILDYLKAGDQ